jgi:hypothetical protein
MSTTGVVRLPQPHPGQMTVRRQAKRLNILSAGRRWRKTTLVMAIAVEKALEGQSLMWGAPTFDQVRVGWDETRHAAGRVATFTQQRMEAHFPTGGRILYRSLDDPDNARGHTADGVVIDEGGDVNERAWYEVLRPMLIDTGGWAWIIGTPKGRNWFFREHVAARSRDDSAAWQVPTVGCEIDGTRLVRKPHPMENPDVPWREIEQLWATTPERVFRQEILAEFIEGEGAVFRNIAACLAHPGDADHSGHHIVCGVDWGKHADFTAISVFCADCRREVAHDRFNQIDYAFQRGRLQALCARYHVEMVLAESNAMGEPVIEQLQRDGVPVRGFQTTAASKPPLIESLALAFERSEAVWLDDPVWTSELEAYERTVSGTTGRSAYSAPSGLHDDTVMARALAWRAADQPHATKLVTFL